VSIPDLKVLAQEERTDLLALLCDLGEEEWNAQSLCSRWSVRDVATHVVSYDELSVPALVGTFVRGGIKVSGVNAVALNRYSDLQTDAVIDLLARNLSPSGLPAGFGGGIALTDGTIHHQDIRRALGRPRTIPSHRLEPVLDFALGAPTLPAKKNAKALKLTATDVDWTTGDGPEVSGPGEAILMAMAGRPDSLDELTGPGLATLRARVE
jgi:uncharacterized protein (TIGR03083 family)